MKRIDPYTTTIASYKKLGKSYLEAIKHYTPVQLYIFMRYLSPGSKILDVGCAGGKDAAKFIENGFKVVGIDMVDEFLEEAKKEVPKADFQKMDLLDMGFPQDYFDGIWSSAVLVHIKKKDISRVLQSFHKILKPSGELFIGVKRGKGFFFETDTLSQEKRLMVFFLEKEIRTLVEKAGFRNVYCTTSPDETGRKKIQWIRLIAEKI